ncbi:MAG TPA: cellulose binding domain-containing protein [Polyangiaceae bacterium]|jgi:cellulose 1,4-beta-cellobiosidase|nr:cellulose binding domain-containing protein [Polyangiaceae bacterium]
MRKNVVTCNCRRAAVAFLVACLLECAGAKSDNSLGASSTTGYSGQFGASAAEGSGSGASGTTASGSALAGGGFGTGNNNGSSSGVATGGSTGMDTDGSVGIAAGSGAASSAGASHDAGSGSDNGFDATAVDAWNGASDAGQVESGLPSAGLSILYKVEIAAATSAYLGCQLSVKNSGNGSPEVSALAVRYYFTDEVRLTPQLHLNWSHISTLHADADLKVAGSFAPFAPPAAGADTYIEFKLSSGHRLLGPGESAVFSWQMQGPDPSKNLYIQTNDYSFDLTKTDFASWDRVVLLQNGSVVWGQLP